MALTKYEVGSEIPSFSIRCSSNNAVAPAAMGVAMLVPPMQQYSVSALSEPHPHDDAAGPEYLDLVEQI